MNVDIKDIKIINSKPTDVIVVRFKGGSVDELDVWRRQIQNIFPNNNVIVLPNNMDLEVCSKELWNDYIQMVNEYINNL